MLAMCLLLYSSKPPILKDVGLTSADFFYFATISVVNIADISTSAI